MHVPYEVLQGQEVQRFLLRRFPIQYGLQQELQLLWSWLSRLRWQVQRWIKEVLMTPVQLVREAQGDDCAAAPSPRWRQY